MRPPEDRPTTKTAPTGGARDIGRACALALADAGFDIALVDLLKAEMAATARRTQCFQTQCRQRYRW
jgi:NAD(P)-dependent dehydrogenase (short-subunit alcohol dehydrogenase family)